MQNAKNIFIASLIMLFLGCTNEEPITSLVPSVTNSTTGRVWMDRNLGATQVATSSIDEAGYGDLYQWGRRKDGHQRKLLVKHPRRFLFPPLEFYQ